MSAANNPLNKSGEPVTWNFKLLAQNDLGGFGEAAGLYDRDEGPQLVDVDQGAHGRLQCRHPCPAIHHHR